MRPRVVIFSGGYYGSTISSCPGSTAGNLLNTPRSRLPRSAEQRYSCAVRSQPAQSPPRSPRFWWGRCGYIAASAEFPQGRSTKSDASIDLGRNPDWTERGLGHALSVTRCDSGCTHTSPASMYLSEECIYGHAFRGFTALSIEYSDAGINRFLQVLADLLSVYGAFLILISVAFPRSKIRYGAQVCATGTLYIYHSKAIGECRARNAAARQLRLKGKKSLRPHFAKGGHQRVCRGDYKAV